MGKRKAGAAIETPSKVMKVQSKKSNKPKDDNNISASVNMKKLKRKQSQESQVNISNVKKLKTKSDTKSSITIKNPGKYAIKKPLTYKSETIQVVPKLEKTDNFKVKPKQNVNQLDPEEEKEIDEFCNDIEDKSAHKTFDEWIKKLDEVLVSYKL